MILWSSSDVETLMQMKSAGLSNEAIAERLGRTAKAVSAKLEYVALSPAQREERRQHLRERRLRKNPPQRLHENSQIVEATRPNLSQISERMARYAAPHRDLAGMLFGDPPVGYSALERRV